MNVLLTSVFPTSFSRTHVLRTARHWHAVARSRKALANLDDAALTDLGLTKSQAKVESSRSAWDAPSNWIKC